MKLKSFVLRGGEGKETFEIIISGFFMKCTLKTNFVFFSILARVHTPQSLYTLRLHRPPQALLHKTRDDGCAGLQRGVRDLHVV